MDASDHLESIVFIAVAVAAVSETGRSHAGKIGDRKQSQTVAAIP
jgi:hypothetical protein